MLSVTEEGIKYLFFFFLIFGMIWSGIEPQFPGPLANTLTIMAMSSSWLILLVNIVPQLFFDKDIFDNK